MRPAPCRRRGSSAPIRPASAAEPPSRRRTTSPPARGSYTTRRASRCCPGRERAAELALLAFELNHRAAQSHARGEGAGPAEILGGAFPVLVPVHALDVDHRVAAFLARALLQRDHRADKGDLAGFLVGLVGGVGLAVGGALAHLPVDRRRLLLAEVDADLGVDAVLGALALLHAIGDREHQAIVARERGRCGDGENRSRGCEADCALHVILPVVLFRPAARASPGCGADRTACRTSGTAPGCACRRSRKRPRSRRLSRLRYSRGYRTSRAGSLPARTTGSRSSRRPRRAHFPCRRSSAPPTVQFVARASASPPAWAPRRSSSSRDGRR